MNTVCCLCTCFINWLWRRCLQSAHVLIAENCETAGCSQGHKPFGFPESPGNTTVFMKTINKHFLISMQVQCSVGQTSWQIRYNIPLFEAKMAEAAALVVLHLLWTLALESWPCSLPHQSSPTSPISTFAPGQLLSPYLHVSCPSTSTTSSSHIPHQLLSLPPSAHLDYINAPDRTQLTLSRTSWVWLHSLPVLAELICSSLLLHLTCSGFVPCWMESTRPEKARIFSRSLYTEFYELRVTVARMTRLTWISLTYNLDSLTTFGSELRRISNIILQERKKKRWSS